MPAPRSPVATVQKPSKCGRKPKPATPTGLVVMDRLKWLQNKARVFAVHDENAAALLKVTGVRMESGQVVDTVPSYGLRLLWAIRYLNTGRL